MAGALVDHISSVTGLPSEFFIGRGQTWHREPTQMGGGALAELDPHHLDGMLWLADAPAVEVMAMTDKAGMPVECFVNVQA